MQAGVRDPRAAREFAVFAARQNPRDVVADRSLPVRRTDAARHLDQALGRIRGRRRPLHRVPQVRHALPGQYRLRRSVDEHAQPAAQDGQEELQPRQGRVDVLPQRHRSGHHQRHARSDDRLGLQAQRVGHDLLKKFAKKQTKAPPPSTGKPAVRQQVIHFINKKMPGNLPKKSARALLDIEDDKVIPIIRNPKTTTADTEAVFYFPGCGSERLFSQVGLATQAMLWEVGVQTVLPPGYLCCGYPQRGAGEFDKAEKMMTDNRVLFHRMANTLNYLDIKTVLVSCGTCYDQLATYQFEKIFPGCRIMDIHEYLLEKQVKLEGVNGTRYMYHEPCHNPMKLQESGKTINSLISTVDNVKIEKNDRCCGESGTLAVARPDISTQVRFRKEEEMVKGADKLRNDGFEGDVKILTSCPSCLQGLSRYNDDSGTTADYIVVELARHLLGENWMPDYVKRANDGGIERVLV